MVRKEAFRKVGGFDEKLVVCEDQTLFYRLSKIGRTRADLSLVVYEQGRRAHAMGWLRLYYVWAINILSVVLFRRSLDREWKEIR